VSWSLNGKPLGSVLLTRLRYLGDIVMSTVMIEALKRGDPDLRIGYLCEDEHASVLVDHPGIDRLHRLQTKRTGNDAKARISREGFSDSARSALQTIGDLRQARYDLAVDLFFNPRSAWLLKLAGIPQRIGGTRKLRGRLFSHRVLRDEVVAQHPDFNQLAPGGLGEHLCRLAPLTQVESGLDFISWLITKFQPGELKPHLAAVGDDGTLEKHLVRLGVDPGQPYILLAPCATWPSKEWPGANWAKLITILLERSQMPLVVMVAPGKEGVWGELGANIPRERGGMIPAMPLPGALALTAGARALLTVDGGIMHAAVGLDVPTVALFGPTDPDIWFPYAGFGPFRVLARVPHCHPCDLHECPAFVCLPDLDPTVVLEELETLLDETQPAKGTGA
jgi:ADP-heptose:LPS heptosyltransferase